VRSSLLVLLVLLVAGCWGRGPAGAPPPGSAEARGAPLVVAREDGLFEIAADGRDVRRLSATPAEQPRWQVKGQRLVFLTRDYGELRSLDLATGREQVVAKIRSKLACDGDGDGDGGGPILTENPGAEAREIELRIHSSDDVVVQGTRACLRLMDRNSNMSFYALDVRVDLATGKVADYLSLALEHCKLPQSKPPDECTAAPLPSIAAAGGAYDPAFEASVAGPTGLGVQSRSPSGRWALLRGNVEQGDYIHSQIALYEVATRRTFPIVGGLVENSSAWPAPLTPAQLALDAGELGRILGDVVGETTIYWLAGPGDRLVIDEALVVPGVRIVDIGQLAF
jgi:hypothetical protein